MATDNLAGKKVSHKDFGEGVITKLENNCVVVDFKSQTGEKKFIYPLCFKNFLTLVDTGVANSVLLEIEKKEKEECERREKEGCEQREQEERSRRENSERSRGKHGNHTSSLRIFSSVAGFCDEYERYLVAEIAYLCNNGGKRQRIFDGKLIEKKNSSFLYSFEADSELNYPDGTQITLWASTGGIHGNVICCEDFTITIAANVTLGDKVASIEFSAEPWKLLNFLIERLHRLHEIPASPIIQALVCDGRKNIQYNSSITKGQDNACKMASSQPITFVWGPPGTGKTETLAKIALQHIQLGNRVLMLSYSNVSVDGAILRVHKLDKLCKAGKLIRYGYPRDKSLLQHDYLSSYNLVIQNHPDLLNERSQLLAVRRKFTSTQKASPRYVQIQTRLTQIRNQLVEEEKSAVKAARFIATTVSKAIADKTIYEDDYDVVIFDEASMAYIPQIVFSAGLAKKHFICMGDFAQLPPIVQNSSNSILNADIFRYCGISDAVESGWGHKWLCLLDTQYRMHPQIADFSSINMYRSLLRSAEGMENNRKSISHGAPLEGYPIGIADLSGMMSVCTQTADSSRVNPLSALVTFGLALNGAAHHDVGIITPYNAQSRLYHAMARDVAEKNAGLHQITCATVHQFQGSEKDVIIYDAVDCYRQRYPGALLTSTSDNYANRLFNVALTRSRGKFVAVANVAYMENKNLSSNLMFAKLLRQYKHTKQGLEGIKFDAELADAPSGCYLWLTAQRGNKLFLQDIHVAKNEVRIDIPGRMSKDEQYAEKLASVLQAAQTRGVKVVIRAEEKKTLPKCLQQFSIQNPYVANPITLIDKRIIWFGEPLSEANFISESVTLQTRYRPIIRFEGCHTATSLYGFLEMNRTVDQATGNFNDGDTNDTFAQYVASHCFCSVCGKPMKLKKGKSFFLGCSGYPNCKNAQPVETSLVEKYFYNKSKKGKLCQQCPTSLEARTGPYGVYVQCCGLSRHRYRLDEI